MMIKLLVIVASLFSLAHGAKIYFVSTDAVGGDPNKRAATTCTGVEDCNFHPWMAYSPPTDVSTPAYTGNDIFHAHPPTSASSSIVTFPVNPGGAVYKFLHGHFTWMGATHDASYCGTGGFVGNIYMGTGISGTAVWSYNWNGVIMPLMIPFVIPISGNSITFSATVAGIYNCAAAGFLHVTATTNFIQTFSPAVNSVVDAAPGFTITITAAETIVVINSAKKATLLQLCSGDADYIEAYSALYTSVVSGSTITLTPTSVLGGCTYKVVLDAGIDIALDPGVTYLFATKISDAPPAPPVHSLHLVSADAANSDDERAATTCDAIFFDCIWYDWMSYSPPTTQATPPYTGDDIFHTHPPNPASTSKVTYQLNPASGTVYRNLYGFLTWTGQAYNSNYCGPTDSNAGFTAKIHMSASNSGTAAWTYVWDGTVKPLMIPFAIPITSNTISFGATVTGPHSCAAATWLHVTASTNYVSNYCPMIGAVVTPGTGFRITMEAAYPITVVDGTKDIILKRKCGQSVSWTDADSVALSTALSGQIISFTTNAVIGDADPAGCSYVVEFEDGAAHLDHAAGVLYQFSTAAGTQDVEFEFTLDTTIENFRAGPIKKAIASTDCSGSNEPTVTASAGSIVVNVLYTNLAPGSGNSLIAFLLTLFNSAPFSAQLQSNGQGTVVKGSVTLVGNAGELENVLIVNDGASAGATSKVIISATIPTVCPSTCPTPVVPTNGKIKVMFPHEWNFVPIEVSMKFCLTTGCTPTTTPTNAVPSQNGNMLIWTMTPADGFTLSGGGEFVLELNGAHLPNTCMSLNGWIWAVQLTQNDDTVNYFYMGNPADDRCQDRTVIVFGDPHFAAFPGGFFDITGTVGAVYNIISDTEFVWNSEFVGDNIRKRAADLHNAMYTYLGPTALLVFDTVLVMDPVSGNLTWNGQVVKTPGVRLNLGGSDGNNDNKYYVKVNPRLFIVRAPGFRLALKTIIFRKGMHNNHFDHAIDLISTEAIHPHGILGQTAHYNAPITAVDKKGTGIIEGTLIEYQLQRLEQLQYRYNRYHMSPVALHRMQSHWSYQWFNRLPVPTGSLKSDGFEVVQLSGKTRTPHAFWVTHVEHFEFRRETRKKERVEMKFLHHSLFNITISAFGDWIEQVSVTLANGKWVKLHADQMTVEMQTRTTILHRVLVGEIENLKLWVEVHPLSSHGVVLTFANYFTLYLRSDDVLNPYFVLQVEVHDPSAMTATASGIFVDALISPIVRCVGECIMRH